MGWFWADPVPRKPARAQIAQEQDKRPAGHPKDGVPPPSCPMHDPATGALRLAAASTATATTSSPPATNTTPPSSCPMHNNPDPNHGVPSASTLSTLTSALNPLNLMPHDLSSNPEHSSQPVPLPLDRTVSSIPKGTSTADGNWEYPSPQQMYNAMRRKGYAERDADEVRSIVNMVEVHNFLNEGAWGEIVGWEDEFSSGVLEAVKRRRRGDWEEAGAGGAGEPRLLRFQGRSQDMSPKARVLQLLGRVYPSKFAGPAPFDRHDWYVLRGAGDDGRDTKAPEQPKVVRYVIDYYAGDPEPTGEPVFYLDVRPALDRPAAVAERFVRWGGDVWWKASGAEARERAERERGRDRG